MNRPPLDRLRGVVLGAADLGEPARSAYLDHACAGDPALRAEAERLLAADDRALASVTGQLASIARDLSTVEAACAPQPGQRLGPYVLERLLGTGGSGTVYAARQEEPVRRRVAIKLLHRNRPLSADLARFRAEQQILARLDHPNIAKVHDAGTTDAGVPFFVLELVQGEPISRFVRAAGLGLADRLALCLQACRAAEHAHGKGIIHRDLKPSNILVHATAEGPLVKVIDFGIARLVEPDGGDALTLDGMHLGTPESMSPEQAAGIQGDCDVKTDVHALGNLLHEVLCGRGVYDVGSLSTAAQLRVVAAGRRDLSAVDDRGHTLPTDLRRIIAMATEPERERRYGTAAALAEDIERYRTRRPVIARGAGPWYLARKAAERHPVSAALLVLLTVVIVGSLAVLVNLNAREREAVRVAQAESARSASLARYLTGMMKSPDPMRLGPDVTMVAAFADAAGRAEAELAGDPRTLADVLKTIASVQMALDNNETALATLVRAEAAKIRDPQHTPVDLLALRMNRIDMLFAMGRYAEADSIVHAIAATAHDRPDMASIEAKARLALSKHQVMMGEFTEADRNASRARELLLSLPDPNRTDLVFTRRLQALCLERHGSRAAAIGLLRRELAECVRDLDLDTPPVLAVKGDLASVLGDDGGEESVRLQQEALASAIKLIGPDHLDVAKYDCHLAYYLARVGRADEALPHAEKASRVWRGRFGRLHPRTAKAEHTLAYVSRARGDLVGAERHAREALLIYAALEIPSLAVFALDTHGELAQALLGQGRLPEAEAAARDGLRDVRDELAGYLGVGRVRCVLGTVLLAAGRSQEAAAEFEAARTVNDAQDPPCRTLAARVDGGLSRARANGGLAGSP